MATLTTLQPETVTKLQNLIQIAIESAKGFECVNTAKHGNKQVSKAFKTLAKERNVFADQIKQFVEWTGDENVGVNAIDQWWIDAPNQASNDLGELLEQIARAEQAVGELYGRIVEDTIGTPAYDVLVNQQRIVEDAAQQIENLRDQITK